MSDPNRFTHVAQLNGTPRRRYYAGGNLRRALAIDDLRARTHRVLPTFALEYMEGGSGDEASLLRERTAFADWRFTPRTLVDVSKRTLRTEVLGKPVYNPVIVAPTGLNGVFMRHADTELAKGAARAGVPFVQSTMSNDRMEDVAKVKGLRHWWQLYVFGGDEVWQELVRRADACGCEALVLTTNTQIFGDREWDSRTRATQTRPSVPTILDAALHPTWLAKTLNHGMPVFENCIDFIPKSRHGFFESAFWIRENMPKSMSWDTVAKIRERWKKPFFLKGLLHLEDVRLAMQTGVDGIILGSHGGRQLDWTVSALDLLPRAREIVGDQKALMMTGGVRRGTDVLKAVALGADAVLAGRASLYGLCAYGAAGVAHALEILRKEMFESIGLLGVNTLQELRERRSEFLVGVSGAAPTSEPAEEAPTAWTAPGREPRAEQPTAH
jgi:(S)-mandelate dehydrogenase